MSKFATKAADSPFYLARMEASKVNDRLASREGAADETGIDRSRMARVELGSANPTPEEVLLLADTYDAPQLLNYYCSMCCPIGRQNVKPCAVQEFDRVMMQALAALQGTIALLQRIRQEIQYRRADLQSLYRQLCREGLLPQNPGGTLQQVPAPWQLSAEERACFAECFSGIGRAEAAQECERLGYYTARFEDYLQQARRTAQRQAGLPHRLGLAGGMMLALLFW